MRGLFMYTCLVLHIYYTSFNQGHLVQSVPEAIMKCLTMLGLACVVSASASKCRQLYCVEPSFERQQFSEAHPDVHAFIAEDMSSRAGAYLRKAIHYMQIGRTKVEEVERSGQDLGELAFGMAYQVAQHVSARYPQAVAAPCKLTLGL